MVFSMLKYFCWVFLPKYLVPSTENSYFGKATEFVDETKSSQNLSKILRNKKRPGEYCRRGIGAGTANYSCAQIDKTCRRSTSVARGASAACSTIQYAFSGMLVPPICRYLTLST